jgi:zinc protease
MFLRLTLALLFLALPVSAPPARADIPIQAVTSPGGIRAWLVEDRSIPFTALEIRFLGGTSLDAPGRRGAVNLMTALIEEGTGEMDAQGFAAARDGLAAEFRFTANVDAVGVSARFLTENRDQAVDLLRQALTAPRFDADALDRVRGQVLAGIADDAENPEAIAATTFDALAWGAAHPYGSSGDGTAESVAALTRDDIVAAHRAALARDRVYVAAAGDISAADLGGLIDRLLAGLPAVGAPMPPAAAWQAGGGVTVIDYPVPQATVIFGHEGITRHDPDFFPAFILNEILGGDRFGSRLMTEVRERRGLTYGIGTSLAPMDLGAMYIGQFASDNAKTAEAIGVVRAEWGRIATEGVSDRELADAKAYLTGSYPLRFDGNAAIARILVGMQMDGLPVDYPVTRNDKVNAVTQDDIRRVAARIFRTGDLRFVVVGQPAGLAAEGG